MDVDFFFVPFFSCRWFFRLLFFYRFSFIRFFEFALNSFLVFGSFRCLPIFSSRRRVLTRACMCDIDTRTKIAAVQQRRINRTCDWTEKRCELNDVVVCCAFLCRPIHFLSFFIYFWISTFASSHALFDCANIRFCLSARHGQRPNHLQRTIQFVFVDIFFLLKVSIEACKRMQSFTVMHTTQTREWAKSAQQKPNKKERNSSKKN